MQRFADKKTRQHEAGGAAETAQADPEVSVLDREEQAFLESLTRAAEGGDGGDGDDSAPPLPPRIKTPDLTWDSDSESFVREERAEASKGGVGRRLSALFKRNSGKADKGKTAAHLVVPGTTDVDAGGAAQAQTQLTVSEEEREREDLVRVLDSLALGGSDKEGAGQGKEAGSKTPGRAGRFAVGLSAESAALVRRFVVVLKDLVRGVPTAADDLRALLDDRDGALARGFERLPSSLRKLVAQLPRKLTASLGPELLAAAAASQGAKVEAAAVEGGEDLSKSAAAKALLLPLLTKPSALVKMLKAIMNALKLRWPAFIGTSAIWSVALFLLLFVLWYCHKRGREVRLEREAGDAAAAAAGEPPIVVQEPEATTTTATTSALPRPPIGADAAKSGGA